MNCNKCGKEMTKERNVYGRGDSWWCSFCGNTHTFFPEKEKNSEKEDDNKR